MRFHCSSKETISLFLSESNKEEEVEFPQPRRFFHRICTHGYFDLGISAVIVLNVICMAMEHYNQPEVRNHLIIDSASGKICISRTTCSSSERDRYG